VIYEISLPVERVPAFTAAVTELTNGQAILELTASELIG
jgi:hypothetical protein